MLTLTETGDENESLDQSWGEVFLTVTLVPKTQEDKDQVKHLMIKKHFKFCLILVFQTSF